MMISLRPRLPGIAGFRVELLAVGLALYFSLMLNDPLWDAILRTQSMTHAFQRWSMFWSAALAITAFQAALLSCLLWGRASKPAGILLILLTATMHFFADRYGVLYDTSMLRNIFATNPTEAGELITAGLIWDVTWRSALPVTAILLLPLPRAPLRTQIWSKIITLCVCISVTAACMALNFKSFSSTTRNHKGFRHLVLPSSPLVSMGRLAAQAEYVDPHNKDLVDPEAVRPDDQEKRLPLTLVVVVGESVRAANWGLSGYSRQTTPRLAALPSDEVFNFPYAVSCGTNTAVSVPCMFSIHGRANYDESKIRRTESIPEMLARLGVHAVWIDNQSGCKGVCDTIPHHMTGDLLKRQGDGGLPDGALADALEKVLRNDKKDELILLHMLGNHGPAYFRRYPREFQQFTPPCTSNDLATCTQESIVNAYDNAILYTDHLLERLIRRLEQLKGRRVALIYVSDHGESLGEKGIYLHGLPYLIAPEQQIRVPFFIWMPASTRESLGIDRKCLTSHVMQPTHHDALSHTLMGFFDVRSKVYQERMDIFGRCRRAR